jgi:hypothetical protein
VATAIVGGALANKPLNGGEAWVRLSWVLGLQRIGFETYFVEQIGSSSCVDQDGAPAEFADSVNRSHFESVVRDFGLDGRAGLLCDEGREAAGLNRKEIQAAAAGADLLFNISGHLTIAEILEGPQISVHVDLDPGFTQSWDANPAIPFRLATHDHYVTVGLNVGKQGCPIPTGGIEWIPTLPPVLLEHWAGAPTVQGLPRFTTVATWRSPYGQLEIGGLTMGLKHHQFRRLIDLPERVREASFEIALDIHPGDEADLRALREHGWEIVDPRAVAATPGAFRDYVFAATAEFSVAQGVYTETGSGWFSDRSGAYLAAGRPVLVQDTGLREALAVENGGLLAFTSPEEAALGAEEIRRDYRTHATAARSFAETHLDSDLVLARLLDKVGFGG